MQIQNEVLKAGDKLDSIRVLSKEKKISQSTAYRIYEELVIKDLIEARAKSGYYVKRKIRRFSEITEIKNRISDIKPRTSDKIVAFADLGIGTKNAGRFSPSPDISLLPVAKINKSMNEALRLKPDSCLNYENINGNIDLRRQIARQTYNWDGNYNTHEVIITHGCTEALLLSLMTLTKPGDTVLIERPTFFSVYNIIKNLGLKVLEINVHPKTGMNFSYLEECIKRVKISACLFVTNFSNPTGYCMEDEDKEKLVGILAKYNIPLIEDDVYGDIYFGNARPLTCKTFDRKGLVLLCSSLSKSLAPGYRVGWCLPGIFKEKFLRIKLMQTLSSTSPTQAAIAQFFDTGRYDLHMIKLRKALHLNSLKYIGTIENYFPEGTKLTYPGGGLALWIELAPKVDTTNLFYEALAQGINIWPGSIFSASGGFNNFFRIAIGAPHNHKIHSNLQLLGKLASKESSGMIT